MDCQDDVVKWTTIAAALHGGALNYCGSFTSTEEAIDYLYSYKGHGRSTGPFTHSLTVLREHVDFYYHTENWPGKRPGPLGLSRFFGNKTAAHTCLLCKRVALTLNAGKYKCKILAPCNAALRRNAVTGNVGTNSVPVNELNLRRLEHLAVVHTPYFVTLFLDLVQRKRYCFHKTGDARHSIASYIFERFKAEDDLNNKFDQGADSYALLKLWWRLQDKRGTKSLNVSIPSYLGLHTETSIWNPRIDPFANRKADPLYTFLAKNCLCHEIWSYCADSCSHGTLPPPKMTTLTVEQASTFSLGVAAPRLHVEDILHAAVSACNARRVALNVTGHVSASSKQMDCCNLLEPRLDCIILEDVGHPRAVMMHVVTTVDFRWQTLSSWLAGIRGKAPYEQLALNINKVFLGIMGSLRDMCLLDKRPPRHLYTERPHQEPKLAPAFIVHSETGDVLSLLPFVSLPRMCRSSNQAKDEDSFRMACAALALSVLYAHVEISDLDEQIKGWWESGDVPLNIKHPGLDVGTATVENSYRRDTSSLIVNTCRFCRTGLLNDDMWSRLGPKKAGSRDMSKVDVPRVWLGKNSRTHKDLTGKLLALGFPEAPRVCVIELLREEEAADIRKTQQGFTTRRPEVYQSLLSAVTPDERTPSWSDSSCAASMISINTTSYNAAWRASNNKRSNSGSDPAGPQKMFHFDETDDGLVHIRKLVTTLGKGDELAGSSGYPEMSSTEAAAEIYLDPDAQIPNRKAGRIETAPRGDISADLHISKDLHFSTDLHLTAVTPAVDDDIGELPSVEGFETPGTSADVCPFLMENDHTVESAGFNNSLARSNANNPVNVFHNDTQANNNCVSIDVARTLRECFRGQYQEPHTLDRLVTEALHSGIVDNLRLSQQTHAHYPDVRQVVDGRRQRGKP